jgi:short-subunit dehydrogenase
MGISLKPLNEQVIVITGASSGIGLATARLAARKGARLVLAARNGDALRRIADEINEHGGSAVAVQADVGQAADVQKIADAAIQAFGGFDTWVNDAGIGIYGRIEDVSDADGRQLFETNFWGLVQGSRAAMKHLKGRTGAIINLGSQVSDMTMPLHGIYAASKHAIKGFTDTLRLELMQEGEDISVTLIKPAALATPFFEHAMNYTDTEYKAPPPVYAPEEAAKAILFAARHPVRELYVGGAAPLMTLLHRLAPSLVDRYLVKTAPKNAAQVSATVPQGILYDPATDGAVYGHAGAGKVSVYTRAKIHPRMTGAAAAALALGVIALYAMKRNPAGLFGRR